MSAPDVYPSITMRHSNVQWPSPSRRTLGCSILPSAISGRLFQTSAPVIGLKVDGYLSTGAAGTFSDAQFF
jgi:hypothetical protein